MFAALLMLIKRTRLVRRRYAVVEDESGFVSSNLFVDRFGNHEAVQKVNS